MKIKTVFKSGGKTTNIEGLIRGIFKTDLNRLAQEATKTIAGKINEVTNVDSISPEEAENLMLPNSWSNLKKGNFDGHSLITGRNIPGIEKYEKDDELKKHITATAGSNTVELNRDINTPPRNYELNVMNMGRGYITLRPSRLKIHDFVKEYTLGYNIITEWDPAYIGDDGKKHRSRMGSDDIVYRMGAMETVRGRDLMISSFLLSISIILKSMKTRILRNMGGRY